MKIVNNRSRGFTIIELMIATTVFSVILLIATMALIQIGRIYYKGVLSSKTQNVARGIIDEVANSIKFASNANFVNALCTDNKRFSYKIGDQLDSSIPDDYGLVIDRPAACDPNEPRGSSCSGDENCREMLTPGMRLSKFIVVETPQGSGIWQITIGVVSGDTDLLNSDKDSCAASINAGGQCCAASELTTTVIKRV